MSKTRYDQFLESISSVWLSTAEIVEAAQISRPSMANYMRRSILDGVIYDRKRVGMGKMYRVTNMAKVREILNLTRK